jgi:hypothetical protein
MKKHLFTAAALMLFALASSAQQFSKTDQAVIANYPLTIEKVNQYLVFEKGFAAAKTAEPKYASLTPPRTLDEKINLLSPLPSFTELARSAGSNLRDITLTGTALHMLFVASDPKRQANFFRMCDQGYAERPSTEQMAFADAHRSELVQWQKEIIEDGKAELLR